MIDVHHILFIAHFTLASLNKTMCTDVLQARNCNAIFDPDIIDFHKTSSSFQHVGISMLIFLLIPAEAHARISHGMMTSRTERIPVPVASIATIPQAHRTLPLVTFNLDHA
jgi:hypothetical protein